MTAVDPPRTPVARYRVEGKGFRPHLHPRDPRGRFASKPGGRSRSDSSSGPGDAPRRPRPRPAGGMRVARRFTTDEESLEWADTHLAPPELTDDEWSAVGDYTGDYFTDMNNALRNAATTTPDVWTQDRIDHVRSAIAKSPAPETFTVFRGSPPNILDSMIGSVGKFKDDDGEDVNFRLQQLVGRTFDVPTFHSTSIGPKAYFEHSRVQWLIKIPEGQPVLWVEGDLTSTNGEREMLLPDGTRRVIHAAYRGPDYPTDQRIYVEVEIVPPGWTPDADWIPQPFGDAYAGYL